jgi:hypothetical protein
MRALVLVTTNEPLDHLHPALGRPGRCLTEIAFQPFDCAQSADWCSRHGADPPDLSAASLADSYAHVDGRQLRPKRRAIGFAPTAV